MTEVSVAAVAIATTLLEKEIIQKSPEKLNDYREPMKTDYKAF